MTFTSKTEPVFIGDLAESFTSKMPVVHKDIQLRMREVSASTLRAGQVRRYALQLGVRRLFFNLRMASSTRSGCGVDRHASAFLRQSLRDRPTDAAVEPVTSACLSFSLRSMVPPLLKRI